MSCVSRRGAAAPVLAFLLFVCTAWSFPEFSGRVVDENGVPVPGAKLTATAASLGGPLSAVTDEAGRFTLRQIPIGSFSLRVDKLGYYAFVSDFELGENPAPVEIVLNHQQEFGETVNVVYAAPTVDPQETSARYTLTSEEIQSVTLFSTHDFRNSLPLIPGVYKDNAGRVHMNGGGEDQAYYSLDGFNVTSPASGTLQNRISVDALRNVSVETSRYSAEYGKGSAGVMALETSRGDDHYRFSATNFLPSYEFHNGLTLSNWTPRATVSGPLVKGKAWFFDAVDLQYDLNIVDSLPSTANTNRNWAGSNMTVVQVKLTPTNILTGSLLGNFQNARHYGLTALDPVETTRNRKERFYFANIKDQIYFPGGWILDAGFAVNRLNTRDRPLGDEVYRITPEGRRGNYFQYVESSIQRFQGIANVAAPEWRWKGIHRVKFGMDANRVHFDQFASRHPYEVVGPKATVTRFVRFEGNSQFGRSSSEFSGFVQDRWLPLDSLVLETGLRLDWDQILREPLASPRFAFSWAPPWIPESRFSAGVGVFRDALNLGLLTRALDQQRIDTFYEPDGITIRLGPLLSRWVADERLLKAPSYLNWSVGWEQRVPRSFYLRTNFIRKYGRHGWCYNFPDSGGSAQTEYPFLLGDLRRDSYSYLEFTLTRAFGKGYNWLLSYARSSARSTAVLDYSLENPVFGPQGGAPLDWDTPNRLISWGLLPAPFLKKYTVAYFSEWHSGFPFTVVNDVQQVVGPPNAARFPDYFSLNVHVERRFRFFRGYQWALRAGFNNITGHHNPVVVINNIDSPNFGQFSGGQGRVFTGRIRFLGKN